MGNCIKNGQVQGREVSAQAAPDLTHLTAFQSTEVGCAVQAQLRVACTQLIVIW